MRVWAYVTVLSSTVGFILAVVVGLWHGVTWLDVGLFTAMYAVTAFGVEGGMHRHFAHRSFAAGPAMTTAIGVAASMAAQGPIMFWVSVHRKHHAFADRDGDPHSPRPRGEGWWAALQGLWHGHIGWLFSVRITDWYKLVPDLLRDRRVVTLDRWYGGWVLIGLAVPAVLGWALGGHLFDALGGLLWGGFARIFVVDHVTWTVNSLGHTIGHRTHNTRDASHNIASLATVSVGGSWHNNHHAQPSLAHNRQRFWQIDPTGALIKLLDGAGLIGQVRYPPSRLKTSVPQGD